MMIESFHKFSTKFRCGFHIKIGGDLTRTVEVLLE